MHTINLVVGDWSGDGHNITNTVTYECNFDKKTLELLYKRGVEKTGIDITKCCVDYQENSLDEETMAILSRLGLIDLDEQDEYMWTDSFARLYMQIAEIGSEGELEYKEVTNASINIGGYGLYQ